MFCDICKKNPPTIHFTQIVNGRETKLNICESCAKDAGILSNILPDKPAFFLSPLVAGLGADTKENAGKKCPVCGLAWREFQETGKLGCAACYKTFREELLPLLKQLHGSQQHQGKEPALETAAAKQPGGEESPEKVIKKLEQELKEAVQKEEYEKAALLRDRIQALKKQGPS